MVLVKCKKCGAVVMTQETLLQTMQDTYDEICKKAHRAKGADKNVYIQQMAHITKMMTAIVHSNAQIAERQGRVYSEYCEIIHYINDNKLIPVEVLNELRTKGREKAKVQTARDEARIATVYSDFMNEFCNRTKSDHTANTAIQNVLKP